MRTLTATHVPLPFDPPRGRGANPSQSSPGSGDDPAARESEPSGGYDPAADPTAPEAWREVLGSRAEVLAKEEESR